MNEWQLDYSLVGRLCREKRNWSLLRGRIEISQMNFRKKMCFVSLPDALCHFIAYFRGTWEDDRCICISLALLHLHSYHAIILNKTKQVKKEKWEINEKWLGWDAHKSIRSDTGSWLVSSLESRAHVTICNHNKTIRNQSRWVKRIVWFWDYIFWKWERKVCTLFSQGT